MADKKRIALWRAAALATRETVRYIRERQDYRSCVSRAYYACFQAATAVCIAHGDESQFANGWGDPSHEQLPELIKNNGDLSLSARRKVKQLLLLLRSSRENADYRLGRTVDDLTVRASILAMDSLFELLEIRNDGND